MLSFIFDSVRQFKQLKLIYFIRLFHAFVRQKGATTILKIDIINKLIIKSM